MLQAASQQRLRTAEHLNEELKIFTNRREDQVKLSQDERSKLNFLAFTIAGGILGFRPESLDSPLVFGGLALLIFNSLLFGFIADERQRKHNRENFEIASEETRKAVEPYYDAYDELISYVDDPGKTMSGTQEKFSAMEQAYFAYLDFNKQNRRSPIYAKRTRLSIGYMYYFFFAFGLTLIAVGLSALTSKPPLLINGTVLMQR